MSVREATWLVVDKNGLRKGLPPNLAAGAVAARLVVGDAVLIKLMAENDK